MQDLLCKGIIKESYHFHVNDENDIQAENQKIFLVEIIFEVLVFKDNNIRSGWKFHKL